MECPKCGANLRDKDISHSEFGQYVHDKLPRTFYWSDTDGNSYKKATRILRVIEEKKPGQGLKKSQKCILPLFAEGIDYLISLRRVHEQSGVFIIHTEPPYDSAIVSQICSKKKSLALQLAKNVIGPMPIVIGKVFKNIQEQYPNTTLDEIAWLIGYYFKERELTKAELNAFASGEKFPGENT
jgi:hypothetical protein